MRRDIRVSPRELVVETSRRANGTFPEKFESQRGKLYARVVAD